MCVHQIQSFLFFLQSQGSLAQQKLSFSQNNSKKNITAQGKIPGMKFTIRTKFLGKEINLEPNSLLISLLLSKFSVDYHPKLLSSLIP